MYDAARTARLEDALRTGRIHYGFSVAGYKAFKAGYEIAENYAIQCEERALQAELALAHVRQELAQAQHQLSEAEWRIGELVEEVDYYRVNSRPGTAQRSIQLDHSLALH